MVPSEKRDVDAGLVLVELVAVVPRRTLAPTSVGTVDQDPLELRPLHADGGGQVVAAGVRVVIGEHGPAGSGAREPERSRSAKPAASTCSQTPSSRSTRRALP